MKFRILAVAALALAAGTASAQPPVHDGSKGRGPGGFGLLEFDTNADGKLTKAEFDAAQRARFNKIDANKDGVSTREELEASHKADAETRRAEMSKVRFTAMDTDKSGQLSQAEFAAGAPGQRGDKGPHRGDRGGRKGGGPDGQDGAKRAGQHDADGDGKATFAEFSARGTDAFARADTNKDGTVTVAELQAMRPGRK
ncbi:MAG: EF-hand domain-containing protein [Hyphomonadaceae bacterium]|nr:EF-hand domain-containing protein [Hyphomonadaceae bacterium]